MESHQTTPKLPMLGDVRQWLHSLCCCTAPPKTWHWTVAWAGGNSSSLQDLSRHWRAEKPGCRGFSTMYSGMATLKLGFFLGGGGLHHSFAALNDLGIILHLFCASVCLFREKAINIFSYYREAIENILLHISKSVGEPSVTAGNTCRVFYFIIRLKHFAVKMLIPIESLTQ